MRGIKFGDGRFGYVHIPKVACTSLKNAVYRFDTNEDYDSKKHGTFIHRYYGQQRDDLSDCEYRMLVVRDPVKRFLSAYGNRVLFHGELNESYIRKNAENLLDEIPIYRPGLGQFIDHIESYQKVPSIHHHIKSIRIFTQEPTSAYSHVFKMNEIPKMEGLISSVSGKEFRTRRLQTGGRKYYIQDLSSKQLKKVIEMYEDDYNYLKGFCSISELEKEYKLGGGFV